MGLSVQRRPASWGQQDARILFVLCGDQPLDEGGTQVQGLQGETEHNTATHEAYDTVTRTPSVPILIRTSGNSQPSWIDYITVTSSEAIPCMGKGKSWRETNLRPLEMRYLSNIYISIVHFCKGSHPVPFFLFFYKVYKRSLTPPPLPLLVL